MAKYGNFCCLFGLSPSELSWIPERSNSFVFPLDLLLSLEILSSWAVREPYSTVALAWGFETIHLSIHRKF